MKKLLILILLFSLTGCSSQVDLGVKKDKKEKPVKIEKLKAKKDKILKVQDVDECVEWKDEEKLDCKKTKKVKQYHYISDKKVGKQKINYKGVELEEDLNKRTKNSVHFKIPKNNNLLGAGEIVGDEYVAKFYSGDPFYEDTSSDDTEWYQAEVATTTIDNYSDNQVSTSTVLINFINWLGGYEVLADTDTFYTGAGDGYVGIYGCTWNSCHDALTGNLVAYTATKGDFLTIHGVNNTIRRGFMPVDTTSLPSGAVVSSATFKVNIYQSILAGSYQNGMVVVGTSQAKSTELEIADYDQCGSIDSPSKLSGEINFIANGSSGWATFTLNATGISSIDDNGYTLLGIRAKNDYDDIPITAGASNYIYQRIYYSENTGTASDPYLEITYSASVSGRRTMIIN